MVWGEKAEGEFLAKGQPAPLRESETSLCPATALGVQGPNHGQEELVLGWFSKPLPTYTPLLAPAVGSRLSGAAAVQALES